MKPTTLEEYRANARARALKHYNKVKDDPEFKEKRRKRDKARYDKLMKELRNPPI